MLLLLLLSQSSCCLVGTHYSDLIIRNIKIITNNPLVAEQVVVVYIIPFKIRMVVAPVFILSVAAQTFFCCLIRSYMWWHHQSISQFWLVWVWSSFIGPSVDDEPFRTAPHWSVAAAVRGSRTTSHSGTINGPVGPVSGSTRTLLPEPTCDCDSEIQTSPHDNIHSSVTV